MPEVKVDISEVKKLGQDFEKIGKRTLVALVQRGLDILREEVPERSGNLKQKGIKEPEYDFEKLQAILTVSATSEALGANNGIVHLPSGETREVKLRPQNPFNYTEAVARGRPTIRPRKAKVLLIPVSSAPADESYITSGSKIFIMRTSAKATKANPFDERAAKRLQEESEGIANKVIDGVINASK